MFRSAGFLRPGRACADEIVTVLRGAGIDGSAHHSYQIDEASIRAADLILTMEGAHIQKLTSVDRDGFLKALPLKEAASLLEQYPSGTMAVEELLTRLNTDRDPRTYLDTRWDVDDPYGGRVKGYRQAVAEIDELIRSVFSRLT